MAFRYWVIYADDTRQKPSTIFTINREGKRLDTISWDHSAKAWATRPERAQLSLHGGQ